MSGIIQCIQEAERMRMTAADSPELFSDDNTEIFIMEALKPGDPRANSYEFNTAKISEIKGLNDRKVWKKCPKGRFP